MSNEKKNKHMTLEDRIEIQECLGHGMSFKAIAARIGKDQTTVSKEVKKHVTFTPSSITRHNHNTQEIIQEGAGCPRLMKAPFVCNPCPKFRSACAYTKYSYVAKKANEEYRALLTDSREGIPLNREEFYEIDRVISEGVKNGQHLYHIVGTNNLNVSKSTAYRHLHKGYLSVSQVDFPRVVKFRARKKNREDYVPKGLKVGRSHDDFLAYLQEYNVSEWVEMDTILGRIGGKVILTINFIFCNFIIGLLLDNKTAAEASSKIITLKKRLNDNEIRFGDIFPVLLTDNGGEFSDIFSLINDLDGNEETKLFFCDPYQSSQKPFIEKNHSLVRDILPKGTSFDKLSQEYVNLIFSHVNGIKRKSLNGKSAYDVFSFTFSTEIATILGISYISPKEVIQSERLLNIILKNV
jgi:IS30 family transposase